MDMNEYTLTLLANDRLAQAREAAARRTLLASVTRAPLRARLGRALIALGQRLLPAPTRRVPVPAPQRVAP